MDKTFKPLKQDTNQTRTHVSNFLYSIEILETEACSASISDSGDPETIYEFVEVAPRFPGCEQYPDLNDKELCAYQKLTQYLSRNIKYPEPASRSGIQGRCVIAFIIEKDGKITNSRITQDIGEGCGEEALRGVNSMNSMKESWRPGKQHGIPVRVKFNLPVNFRIISKI